MPAVLILTAERTNWTANSHKSRKKTISFNSDVKFVDLRIVNAELLNETEFASLFLDIQNDIGRRNPLSFFPHFSVD